MEGSPRLADGLFIDVEADVTTVLDSEGGQVFLTNKTGETVLRLCTGEKPVDEIIGEICRDYPSQAPESIRADVIRFLETATSKKIVLWSQ